MGIHLENKTKAAIKIINKKDMKSKDKELVTTEIEILKICQHPNIIRLYDIFENFEYIFIGKKIKIKILLYLISNNILVYLKSFILYYIIF
jgi:serine/threonine protein kinase